MEPYIFRVSLCSYDKDSYVCSIVVTCSGVNPDP